VPATRAASASEGRTPAPKMSAAKAAKPSRASMSHRIRTVSVTPSQSCTTSTPGTGAGTPAGVAR
jgi:hypothetical protein